MPVYLGVTQCLRTATAAGMPECNGTMARKSRELGKPNSFGRSSYPLNGNIDVIVPKLDRVLKLPCVLQLHATLLPMQSVHLSVNMRAAFLVLAAIGAQACQRERTFQHHPHKHVKRQSNFPPALTPDEEILLNSFDSVSISEWSYYYSIALDARYKAYTNRL